MRTETGTRPTQDDAQYTEWKIVGSQMLFQKKVSISMSCDGGEAADFSAARQRTTRLLRRGDAQGSEEQDAGDAGLAKGRAKEGQY